MVNPLRGIYLNNRFYSYIPDSFTESIPIANSSTNSQNSRHFSVQGVKPSSFTISMLLENTYNVRSGDTVIGSTTWLGLSRLADMKSYLGATAISMPINFVAPYGVTYQVVPTGALDVEIYNPDNPSNLGMEFRITLSLDATA